MGDASDTGDTGGITIGDGYRTQVGNLVADGPPHPEDPMLLRFTQFDGFVRSFKVDPMTGELIFTIGVKPDEKYQAFKLTDHMLMRYRFDVYKAPKRARRTKTEPAEEGSKEEVTNG